MIRHFAATLLSAPALALLLAAPAAAEDVRAAAAPSGTLDQPLAADRAPENIFAVEALDEAALQGIAGREDVNQISHAEQVAGVSRNSVGDNSITGDAQIDGNAFQNMSGLSILSVNTGNNVAMNASMNVNVSIQQGP